MSKLPTRLLLLAASLSAASVQADGVLDPWWRAHLKVENLDDGSSGDIVINVRPEWAPRAAARFGQMMHTGFLIQARFFRVVDDFLVQFGISNDPATNLAWKPRKMKDDRVVESNTRGKVSFATSGPDSRTTQVFINTVDNSFLDAQGFAPFGEVIKGMDIVDKIYGGYGDVFPTGRGVEPAKYFMEGGDYLQARFPKLTYVNEVWFDGPEPPDRDDRWIQAAFALPEIVVGASEPQLGSQLGFRLGVALMFSAALVFGLSAQRLFKDWGRRELGAQAEGSARLVREGAVDALE